METGNTRNRRSLRSRALRAVGWPILAAIYAATIALADLAALVRRRRRRANGILVVTGTFHNPNWYFAHIGPLAEAGLEEILVVGDGHVGDIPGVRALAPPPWLRAVLTRAGAKLVLLLLVCWRRRPSMVMGYHIFPAAVCALIAARLTGARSAYQVTAGPLELEGGGWHAENRLLTSLGWPSRSIERLACAVARRFDLVVVRGAKARSFLKRQCRFAGDPVIITGAVTQVDRVLGDDERRYDVLFVGRLAEYKRPDRFVRTLAQVAASKPDVRAIMVGDGPDRPLIEALIEQHGLANNVSLLGIRSDVASLLAHSRVMLQTSRWEGVSIAVLEAMMHGVVPVVSDVGDMRDAVVDGTGYILAPDDIDGYAAAVLRLLSERDHWAQLSEASRRRALATCSTSSVAMRWHAALADAGVL